MVNENDPCSTCLLIGRKTQNIKIMCDKCNFKDCFTCLKAQGKMSRDYMWTCNTCVNWVKIKDQQKMEREIIQKER